MRRSLPVQASAQARHSAAAHRDRLALARSLDQAAALPLENGVSFT